MVLADTFTEIVPRYLKRNQQSGGTGLLKKVCGILIIVAGLYMLYTA